MAKKGIDQNERYMTCYTQTDKEKQKYVRSSISERHQKICNDTAQTNGTDGIKEAIIYGTQTIHLIWPRKTYDRDQNGFTIKKRIVKAWSKKK